MNWSLRQKARACLRFEPSLWRPNVCRRCFCNRSAHPDSSQEGRRSPGADTGSGSRTSDAVRRSASNVEEGTGKSASSQTSALLAERRRSGIGLSSERFGGSADERSKSSTDMTASGSRHVGRTVVKGSAVKDSHFSGAEVVVVGTSTNEDDALSPPLSPASPPLDSESPSALTSSPSSNCQASSPVNAPVSPSSETNGVEAARCDSPTSTGRGRASTSTSETSRQSSRLSGVSSSESGSNVVRSTDDEGGSVAYLSSSSSAGKPAATFHESLKTKNYRSRLRTRHTDGELAVSKASEDSEEADLCRRRTRSHDTAQLAASMDANNMSIQPIKASMSTEAIDSARSPPPFLTKGTSTGSSTSMGELLGHLQNLPSSKARGTSQISSRHRLADGHQYSPHQQYRLPRQPAGYRRTVSDQTNGCVHGRKPWAERQHAAANKNADSPLLKRKEMSVPDAAHHAVTANGTGPELASNGDSRQQSQKRKDSAVKGRISPQKAHDSSAMKFLVSQLEHIVAWWQDADGQMDDLRPMSLADYRLVEDMAADWCDGTAATPLWQADEKGSSGRDDAQRREATVPVVCIRPGLKQPGRIYGLRVRTSNADDNSSSGARFKTDYRVLERIHPHPNVLRVLAHFRDVVPMPKDTSNASSPQAIFVVTNHLPLLNCQQYIPKCKEMLSKEGYERCVVLLMYQLLNGLCHLHTEGAIHCNLTLDNLLVVPTCHPGGGDRLVISSFGDSIYYMTPPKQFALLAADAATMLDSGKGWKLRCQPPELAVVQSDVAQGRKDHLIDLRHCDVYRAGQLLYDMLGYQTEINYYVQQVDTCVKIAGRASAVEDLDISLPSLPVTSCFSEPLSRLAACLVCKDASGRLEPKEALEMAGCILWGPTTVDSTLGLDEGVTADAWLRKRQLEVLAGFAGAYACPTGGQQSGGFALADELQCRFLVSTTPTSIKRSLDRLQTPAD